MLKQIIVLILLSLIVILATPQAHLLITWILSVHHWILETLTPIFSGGEAGNITRKLIALLAAPIVVALIPALIYWLMKRKWFPYFMEFVWVTWLVQTTAIIALYAAASAQ